ncbi:Adenylate kinase family protein [Trichomonas vaginalis G3]|uniref:Adenylate kinase family protein n=1 Tax=Trichomonas vaginalis (strain ATCC PRA-98 / G3) TaxID=412133 RepID=A2FTA8_TRIV3|nr:cytidylate kinase protein [Trichomonas vaginalis G3]EAX91860.1 Adenylate kinase family protein [Trichomonas vaginalis G3]KAI5506381.1 cytidylate kinase protein [Trichomonas vaginalis G3]|eukprot:XP_001304790.1 Adenylate kinase family protein [Trichomonas vaginalis G3]
MEDKDIIFVLGGPGSGKGTQATRISQEFDIGYLSAGDLLRNASKIAKNPPAGFDENLLAEYKEIDQIIAEGKLVPAHVTIKLLRDAMVQGKQKHWFIDGFPRDLSQEAEFVEKCKPCVALLFIDVPDDELTKRLLNRGKTSGRIDDNEESIKKRLVTYNNQTRPVIEKFQAENKVISVDGNRAIDVVHDDIVAQLRKVWSDLPAEPKSKSATAKQSKCCLLI